MIIINKNHSNIKNVKIVVLKNEKTKRAKLRKFILTTKYIQCHTVLGSLCYMVYGMRPLLSSSL
jgi:hypothetical protein